MSEPTAQKKPEPYFQLKNRIEMLMTFGLLTRISTLVGSVEDIPQIFVQPTLQMEILQLLRAKRDEVGHILELPDPDTIDVSIDEVPAIIAWVGGHLIDFFLSGMELARKLEVENQGRLMAFKSIPAGPAT